MKRKTPVIRMQRLKRLNRKEQVVFPSPLIMLRSTVFVYRNGQIHASVRIKFPASGLLYDNNKLSGTIDTEYYHNKNIQAKCRNR